MQCERCNALLQYINRLIVWCLTPLSTMLQLYHGVYWVSYQYYWSIYPDTSQPVSRYAVL